MSAFYCIAASFLVARAMFLQRWGIAFALTVLFLLIALYDYERYKNRKLTIKTWIYLQRLENNLIALRDYHTRLLVKIDDNQRKKYKMFKCDHCPKETDTCKKLVYDTHAECVDEGEAFDQNESTGI